MLAIANAIALFAFQSAKPSPQVVGTLIVATARHQASDLPRPIRTEADLKSLAGKGYRIFRKDDRALAIDTALIAQEPLFLQGQLASLLSASQDGSVPIKDLPEPSRSIILASLAQLGDGNDVEARISLRLDTPCEIQIGEEWMRFDFTDPKGADRLRTAGASVRPPAFPALPKEYVHGTVRIFEPGRNNPEALAIYEGLAPEWRKALAKDREGVGSALSGPVATFAAEIRARLDSMEPGVARSFSSLSPDAQDAIRRAAPIQPGADLTNATVTLRRTRIKLVLEKPGYRGMMGLNDFGRP